MDFAPRRRLKGAVVFAPRRFLASSKGQPQGVKVKALRRRTFLNAVILMKIRAGLHESADVVKAKSCGARSSSMSTPSTVERESV